MVERCGGSFEIYMVQCCSIVSNCLFGSCKTTWNNQSRDVIGLSAFPWIEH